MLLKRSVSEEDLKKLELGVVDVLARAGVESVKPVYAYVLIRSEERCYHFQTEALSILKDGERILVLNEEDVDENALSLVESVEFETLRFLSSSSFAKELLEEGFFSEIELHRALEEYFDEVSRAKELLFVELEIEV